MKFKTEDIPQADNLSSVLRVVEGVHSGRNSYQELSSEIGMVERQGRYYRRAAEILGFIQNHDNHSVLTRRGAQYVAASNQQRQVLLANAILSARLIQRVLPFLEAKQNVTRMELTNFMREITVSTGASMLPRRVNTVINWLKAVDMLRAVGNHLVFGQLPEHVTLICYNDVSEPILPRNYDLQEYRDLAALTEKSNRVIEYFVDEAKRDRANTRHRMLTNLVASKVRASGAMPRSNRFVDMAARIGNQDYIFEMKSSTVSNMHAQIRRGISQLFEYRYLQRAPRAKLVLVLEEQINEPLQWMADYVVEDRGILLVWDGDNRLHCPQSIRSQVGFLL
ncbi:AAA-associated domain-containing protein [candidate division KSB1 bacterium]|nr:AAA-associated domain-containing protein [candidate division KSB1 bacterium]